MCFGRCTHPPNYRPSRDVEHSYHPSRSHCAVYRGEPWWNTPTRPTAPPPASPHPPALEQVSGTCHLPSSPATALLCPGPLASAPVPPPITTHEGRVHLRRDKFPTLFLVVNCLDPPWYLAPGCLSCGQALWLCGLGHFLSERTGTAREGALLLWTVMGISTTDTA